MQSQKKSIEQVIKESHPEFMEEVVGLSIEHLNARLAQLAKDTEATEDAKDADEALLEAQQVATSMAAPYREIKKAIRLKSKFLVKLVNEKGGS